MLIEYFILKGFKEDNRGEYEATRINYFTEFPSDEEITSFINGYELSRAEIVKAYNVIEERELSHANNNEHL